jgi:hypothetical protein
MSLRPYRIAYNMIGEDLISDLSRYVSSVINFIYWRPWSYGLPMPKEFPEWAKTCVFGFPKWLIFIRKNGLRAIFSTTFENLIRGGRRQRRLLGYGMCPLIGMPPKQSPELALGSVDRLGKSSRRVAGPQKSQKQVKSGPEISDSGSGRRLTGRRRNRSGSRVASG